MPNASLVRQHSITSVALHLAPNSYLDASLQSFGSEPFELCGNAETLVNPDLQQPAESAETVDLNMVAFRTPADGDHGSFHSIGTGNGCLSNGYSTNTSSLAAGLTHSINQGSVLSTHLDCMINILKRGGIAGQYTRAPQLIDDMLSGFLEESWPCMKTWYAITDSYTTIRWVLWWQISRTSEALDDIPETNTPTPVQIALPHASIIDWIPFPSIRNTLILSQEYDIDQIFCDMTETFVLQKEGSNALANESSVTTYKSVSSFLQAALRSTADVDPSYSRSSRTVAEDDIFGEGPLKRIQAAASAYCQQLINFGGWVLKLDPSFFAKYPGLYEASIVAKGPCCDLINGPRIRKPKPLNVTAMNTYASLLLKDQNYRTYGMDSRLKHTYLRAG